MAKIISLFSYLAKEGRKWITKQTFPKELILYKWLIEIFPSTSLEWSVVWHKTKAPEDAFLLWVVHKGMLVNEWRRKNSAKIDKSCPHSGHNRVNRWNIYSTIVLSLNKGDTMLPTSCGNSLPKEGILARRKHFLWCNVFSIDLCARHLNGSLAFGSPWGMVLCGLPGANKMTLC